MRGNRRVDTQPELALRRALHASGLRYRVDAPIRLPDARPVRPDIVFSRRKLCVFVDGCFWHGCPEHGRMPTANREYWSAKLTSNRERDLRTSEALAAAGWTVLRVWEHEDTALAAARVRALLGAHAKRATALPPPHKMRDQA